MPSTTRETRDSKTPTATRIGQDGEIAPTSKDASEVSTDRLYQGRHESCRLIVETAVASSISTDPTQSASPALPGTPAPARARSFRARRLQTYRIVDVAMLVLAAVAALLTSPG